MAAEKTLAIMTRIVDFSESSCVITCYTRDFGKIGALAKGARRPKGPFEGALDLLSVSRIVFLHKSSGSLDLLTEAKLERRFRAAERDLRRLYGGYYIAELLNSLTVDHDPNPAAFDLANDTLKMLDQDADVSRAILTFELKMLAHCGQAPSLENCVVCGEPVTSNRRVAFGLVAGGVMCDKCLAGQRKVIRVSKTVIDAMIQILDSTELDEPAQAEQRSQQRSQAANGELRAVVNTYMTHQLGHSPRMTKYLRDVTR